MGKNSSSSPRIPESTNFPCRGVAASPDAAAGGWSLLPSNSFNPFPPSSDCVASRDPYCVYNRDTYMCELNQLSPETVDDKYE